MGIVFGDRTRALVCGCDCGTGAFSVGRLLWYVGMYRCVDALVLLRRRSGIENACGLLGLGFGKDGVLMG